MTWKDVESRCANRPVQKFMDHVTAPVAPVVCFCNISCKQKSTWRGNCRSEMCVFLWPVLALRPIY